MSTNVLSHNMGIAPVCRTARCKQHSVWYVPSHFLVINVCDLYEGKLSFLVNLKDSRIWTNGFTTRTSLSCVWVHLPWQQEETAYHKVGILFMGKTNSTLFMANLCIEPAALQWQAVGMWTELAQRNIESWATVIYALFFREDHKQGNDDKNSYYFWDLMFSLSCRMWHTVW
jgi:hypothetical protein